MIEPVSRLCITALVFRRRARFSFNYHYRYHLSAMPFFVGSQNIVIDNSPLTNVQGDTHHYDFDNHVRGYDDPTNLNPDQSTPTAKKRDHSIRSRDHYIRSRVVPKISRHIKPSPRSENDSAISTPAFQLQRFEGKLITPLV